MERETHNHSGDAGQRPAQAYLDQLRPTSRRTMRQVLARLGALLQGHSVPLQEPETYPWDRLRGEQIAWLRQELARHYAPATVKKMLEALRGVLRAAENRGLLEAGGPYVGPIRSQPAEAGSGAGAAGSADRSGTDSEPQRVLTQAHLNKLMRVCAADPRPAGRRDAALIAIIAGTGLQRQRVVELQMKDYDPAAGLLNGRSHRGQPRRFHLSASVQQAIEDWLAVCGRQTGALLEPLDKVGRCRGRAMTDQSAYEMLSRRAKKAGLGHVTSRALHYGPAREPLQPCHTKAGEVEYHARAVPYYPPRASREAANSATSLITGLPDPDSD